MKFSVRHVTTYRYSAPVRFGAHTLRLSPRPDAIDLTAHDITVSPAPVTQQPGTDAFDNPLTLLEFDAAAPELRIESRFDGETRDPPPVCPSTLPPLPWPPGTGPDAFLRHAPEPDATVRAFATDLAARCSWTAAHTLDLLNRTLFERTDRHIRQDGYAQTAADTLRTRKGACRDLTVLFIEAARSLGIPARFVSGYQARAESVDGQRHLHAWPEVFLPGAGWRGYDPTHGLPVTDGHVALSVAPDQGGTMPVEGGYYGEAVSSTLNYEIEIGAE